VHVSFLTKVDSFTSREILDKSVVKLQVVVKFTVSHQLEKCPSMRVQVRIASKPRDTANWLNCHSLCAVERAPQGQLCPKRLKKQEEIKVPTLFTDPLMPPLDESMRQLLRSRVLERWRRSGPQIDMPDVLIRFLRREPLSPVDTLALDFILHVEVLKLMRLHS
jgi:hypothetical protein